MHPIVIQGMLDEIDTANSRGDSTTALRLLDIVNDRINLAGLNRSELRGTWWLQRSRALKSNYSARTERTRALDTAIDIFQAHAPDSNDLPVALEARGFLAITESDFDKAADFFYRALDSASHL